MAYVSRSGTQVPAHRQTEYTMHKALERGERNDYWLRLEYITDSACRTIPCNAWVYNYVRGTFSIRQVGLCPKRLWRSFAAYGPETHMRAVKLCQLSLCLLLAGILLMSACSRAPVVLPPHPNRTEPALTPFEPGTGLNPSAPLVAMFLLCVSMKTMSLTLLVMRWRGSPFTPFVFDLDHQQTKKAGPQQRLSSAASGRPLTSP